MSHRLTSSLFFAAALTSASFTAGCLLDEQAPTAHAEGAPLGRVELPMTSVAADGSVYRLRGVSLELLSAGGRRVVTADDDSATFSFSVEPGSVSAKLLDGWSLERSRDGGETFSAVGAVLASRNPAAVAVKPNASTVMTFEFLLRDPSGTVHVQFAARAATGQLHALLYPQEGTGQLAQYRFAQIGMALYFDGSSYATPSEDGLALETYSWTTGVEFYDDRFGVLRDELAPQMSGDALHFTVVARADGAQLLSGDFTANHVPWEPALTLEAGQLWQRLPLDESGYPSAGRFEGQVPFSISLADEEGSTMRGVMNVEYLPSGS